MPLLDCSEIKGKLTFSGNISLTITYGIGNAPQDAIKIIAEKLVTGTHWYASKLICVSVLKNMYVANTM